MKKLQHPIRWGIVGCGDVCEVKSGPAFQKVSGSELSAVMRRNGSLAADFATRHGVPTWYDQAESLIADPKIDAIYIATPPVAHHRYTLMAAAAGKPVYVEKPMAMNHAECQEMIAACEQAQVPLLVAYYRRALPLFVKIKALLDANALGDVRLMRIELFQSPQPELVAAHQLKNWRVNPAIAGGGYFFDLASHQLDLLDFWFGPITSVSGHSVNQAGLYDAEDLVVGHWQHENGVVGAGQWCFTANTGSAREFGEIIGSEGSLRFQFFGKPSLTLNTQEGEQHFTFENPLHIQQPLIETVMAHLDGSGACPSTGETAARTNWVMEQMLH